MIIIIDRLWWVIAIYLFCSYDIVTLGLIGSGFVLPVNISYL